MRHCYEFGTFLKLYYASFLGENYTYSSKDVYVRSTDYDRTIMSAQSLLAGLFEPSDFQIWNEDIKWQPIPIHTVDFANDKVDLKLYLLIFIKLASF